MQLKIFALWLGLGLLAGGAQAEVYVSTDVPRAIPDGPSGIAESHLTIPVNRRLTDVNVVLTITHPFDGDLRLYLEAPNGDVIRLANRCGHSGDNYTNTCFDDEATTEICSGDPPYTGCFIPDVRLYELDDLECWGYWTLRVTDNYAGDVGRIEAWQLEITGTPLAAENPPTALPRALEFSGAFPNPFNASTTFQFSLPSASPVQLVLFDALGRAAATVVDARLPAGNQSVTFDGSKLSSGLYIARLVAGREMSTRKVVLLK